LSTRKAVRYRDAGVDIDEADRAVSSIKKLARRTFTKGVLTEIGSFGASYQLTGFSKPVLVSSADGVGTKLKIAFLTGRHSTVGEDLVNHCVNDIAVQGALPLFFLDYFAVGKLDADVAVKVISGIARGCRNNGCAGICPWPRRWLLKKSTTHSSARLTVAKRSIMATRLPAIRWAVLLPWPASISLRTYSRASRCPAA
jgi:hypothetical protein